MKKVLLAFACFVAFAPLCEAQSKGYRPLTPEQRQAYQAISRAKHHGRLEMMAKNQALPAAFDVRTKLPIPIWDQGSCGSCYLVSTVRTMTSTLVAGGYGKPDNSFMMSAQYGMDSPRDFGGCNGGNGTEVIDWVCRNGWIAETYVDSSGVHNDYPPYEARSGRDRTRAGAKVWMKGADWGFVNANGNPTIEEIKAALYNYGRLNIAIDAGGQFGNGTGTITALGRSIDHEINVVAYDDAKQAFLLENQWGDGWGVNGCRWVTYNASKNIVDWFFVTASPLPPPPPPPGPVPPPPGTVTLIPGSSFTIQGITFQVPSVGGVSPDMTLKQLFDLMQRPVSPMAIPKQTVEPPKVEPMEPKKPDPKPAEEPTGISPQFGDMLVAKLAKVGGVIAKLEKAIVKLEAPVESKVPLVQSQSSATIILLVPSDAEVSFNGFPAKKNSGNLRTFTTPTLVVGEEYFYRVTVGNVTKKVFVRAGVTVTADFTGG